MVAFTLYYKCCFAYSCTSALLYVLFLCTIIRFRRHDPFNSSFFKLCLNLGVADLTALCNCWVLHRFPSFDWLNLGDVARSTSNRSMAQIGSMIAFGSAGVQYLSAGATAFNRLTAIVFAGKHDLVWTPKFLKMIIITMWISSAICVVPLTIIPMEYVVDNVTDEVGTVAFVNENEKKFYFYSYAVFNVIVNAGSMMCYFNIFYSVHKHTKQAAAIAGSNTTNWADVKLGIYGFVIAVLLIIYTITLLLTLNSNHKEDPQKHNEAVALWTGINDIFSGCNPWFIIIFSKQTREYMWKMITRKTEKPKHITTRGQVLHKKMNPSCRVDVARQGNPVSNKHIAKPQKQIPMDKISFQQHEVAALPHEIPISPN